MNIFLPYENNVIKSVESLDDVRLNKQAVECYQLLTMAEREKELGEPTSKGHYHHPVYQFYKSNPAFLATYGLICCFEYFRRFGKWLKPYCYFVDVMYKKNLVEIHKGESGVSVMVPEYTPYYMEGSKRQLNYIRTTENVSKLFQDKLVKKWESDVAKGRPPKWTNRQVPEFYKSREKGD